MADVRPFRALRYAPGIDLSAIVCPPFDTISPEQQRELHERSPYNAVRIELAMDGEEDGGRYQRAAEALRQWRAEGTLRRDERPAFYLYRQEFQHEGRRYARTAVFARVRLVPWEKDEVLPHEQTFGGPKEDRLHLLRATRLNASPVYLLYRDRGGLIEPRLSELLAAAPPKVDFTTDDGQTHALWPIDVPEFVEELIRTLAGEVLYVADGHHRYETALAYRDEMRAKAGEWSGEESENLVMAALTAADDPGLVVLPIHRVTNAPAPLREATARIEEAFHVECLESIDSMLSALEEGATTDSVFGLVSAESDSAFLVSPKAPGAAERFMPEERSPGWKSLDYAIANHAILQYGLGLRDDQMKDYSMVWFTEDALQAIGEVRSGKARYAVLMNPLPARRVLDIADSGERMPQKSTFFYPKLPTGLVFCLLED